MYKIVVNTQASKDLLIIKLYIKEVLKNPYSAIKICNQIKEAMQSLSFSPERFQEINIGRYKVRRMPVGRYNIYYLVDKVTYTVKVIRILFGGKDIEHVAVS